MLFRSTGVYKLNSLRKFAALTPGQTHALSAGLGALGGGAAGYLAGDEENALRNTLGGAVAGGALGYGAGRLITHRQGAPSAANATVAQSEQAANQLSAEVAKSDAQAAMLNSARPKVSPSQEAELLMGTARTQMAPTKEFGTREMATQIGRAHV